MVASGRLYIAAAVVLAAVACGSHDDPSADRRDAAPPAASTASAASSTPASSSPTARPRIVVLGDSLTAGLGLAADQAYPALLQRRLNEEGLNYEMVNAGVSGDTSAGGLRRLDWALDGDVKILIVALGGNDALRGLPPEALKNNLARIIEH